MTRFKIGHQEKAPDGSGAFLLLRSSKLFGLGRFDRSGSTGCGFPALLLFFASFLDKGFARKADFVAFDGKHFDHDLIAELQLVANVADAMFGNFTDMEQAIGTGEKLDEGAEFRES